MEVKKEEILPKSDENTLRIFVFDSFASDDKLV